MKQLIGILALVLCLTACTGATEPSASQPASADAVQSYPTRVAEAELVFDDLPVGLEQVAGIGWCDFDRDGAEEEYEEEIMMETVINVNGMMCPHCKAMVEKVCKAVPGTVDAVVDLQAKNVTVTGDADVSALKKAIVDAGYEVV